MTILKKIAHIFGFKKHTLHESSLSRILQHSAQRPIGMVTAFRGNLTLKDNLNRNKVLENNIRSAGFGFVKVQGHYIENPGTPEQTKVVENTFLIIGDPDNPEKLKGFLKKMGRTFSQDSVLFKPTGGKAILIGTSFAGSWPGLDKEVVVGDWRANTISQFYTKMRGVNKTFTFESVSVPENVFTLGFNK